MFGKRRKTYLIIVPMLLYMNTKLYYFNYYKCNSCAYVESNASTSDFKFIALSPS